MCIFAVRDVVIFLFEKLCRWIFGNPVCKLGVGSVVFVVNLAVNLSLFKMEKNKEPQIYDLSVKFSVVERMVARELLRQYKEKPIGPK